MIKYTIFCILYIYIYIFVQIGDNLIDADQSLFKG